MHGCAQLRVLASGSAGNCTLLQGRHGLVLIDAGLGPRTTARHLEALGLSINDVRAILLTHLDCDHFKTSWFATAEKLGIKIFCDAAKRKNLAAASEERATCVRTFYAARPFEPLDGITVEAIAAAHDDAGSHAFVIECHDTRLGYASDLGHVPAELIEKFIDLDLIAIESNYDPQMQEESGRPFFLQRRVTGGRGHLSNEQAFLAVVAIFDRHERKKLALPSRVVLLHRSRECNCPTLVRELFSTDERVASRFLLANQDESTDWLALRPRASRVNVQLTLAFG